jgi:hypothetical protein
MGNLTIEQRRLIVVIKIKTVALFLLIYLYGVYSYRTFNPEWENLDGKVFFWISEVGMNLSVFLSVWLIFKSKWQTERIFAFSITLADIWIFLILFSLNLVVTPRYLLSALDGDEVSYAKYSISPVEKAVDIVLSTEFYELQPSILIQTTLAMLLILIALCALKCSRAERTTIALVIILIIILLLRIFNRFVIGFDNENTEPLLLGFQIGISLIGFSDLTFRISALVIHCIAITICIRVLIKYSLFSKQAVIIGTVLFSLLPNIISVAFTVYHGNTAMYIVIIGLALIKYFRGFPDVIWGRLFWAFSSLALLISISTFPIVCAFAVSLIKRRGLRSFLEDAKQNIDILSLLIPFSIGHLFRLIKLRHVMYTVEKSGEETGRSIIEKMFLNVQSLLTSLSAPILIFAIIGLYVLLIRDKKIILPFVVFLILSQVAFSVFTVEASMGVTRYVNQWFVPFALFGLIGLVDNLIKLRMCAFRIFNAVGLFLLALLIFIEIKNFNNLISQYDKYYTPKKQFVGIRDWLPKEMIWNLAANPYKNDWIGKEDCILVATPHWRGIPLLMSGSNWNDYKKNIGLYNKESLNDLQFYEYLDDTSKLLAPPQLKTDCVLIAFAPNRELVEQKLTEVGFEVTNSSISSNGIKVSRMVRIKK